MTEQCDHKTGPSETTTENGAEVTRCICGHILLVTEAGDD